MTDPVLEKIVVVHVAECTVPGDDTVFVAAHAGGHVGWYGPISEAVGRGVKAISQAALGAVVWDHVGLFSRLRVAAAGLNASLAGWATGAVDCAVWDLHGRLAGEPVAALLTSVKAAPVPAYASWLGVDLSDPASADALREVASCGWRFTKWSLRRRPSLARADAGPLLADAVHRAAQILGDGFAVDAVGTWDRRLTTSFAGHLRRAGTAVAGGPAGVARRTAVPAARRSTAHSRGGAAQAR